ncbi:MAG: hypothetical protein H6744_13670 [Deltaproteobacteria bacterium]|nr:hypothetical protein [Deltaproteobacteria bacterium]
MCAPGVARADSAWVIAPGQEKLLGEMLGTGVELPGGCRFAGASVERDHVTGRYECAGGRALAVELRHPSEAQGRGVRTAQFSVLAPTGELPPDFSQALRQRIRAHEARWRWSSPNRAPVAANPAGPGDDRLSAARLVPLAAGLVAAFAAALALLVALLRLATRPAAGPLPKPAPRRASPRDALAALATALAAFALLRWLVPPPMLHVDTTRDLLLALDCLRGHPCDAGPPATFGGLVQGALWIRVLALCHAAGLQPDGVQSLTLALHALATAVSWWALRRLASATAALAGAALFFAGAVLVTGYPALWNPSIAPLPLAAFWALLLALAAGAGPLLGALCGVALALCLDSHVIDALLVPTFALTVAMGARRPLAALLAGFAALAGTLALDSGAAWLANLDSLRRASPALPLALPLALAAVAATGLALRRRAHALPPRQRAIVLLVAAAALHAALAWPLSAFFGGEFSVRHLLPGLPPIAWTLGLALAALAWLPTRTLGPLPRRAAAALVAALALSLALGVSRHAIRQATADSPWTFAGIASVADALYGGGLTYAQLHHGLQASNYALLPALAALDPASDPDESVRIAPEQMLDVPVVLAPAEATPTLPPAFQRVPVGADLAAFVGRFRGAIRRDELTVCFEPLAPASPGGGCATVDGTTLPAPGVPSARAYPELSDLRTRFPVDAMARDGLRVTWTWRLALDAAAGPRAVLLMGERAWEITDVQGLTVDSPLPARRVTLSAGDGRTTGTLSVARELRDGDPTLHAAWPPPIIDVPAGELGDLGELVRREPIGSPLPPDDPAMLP